MSRNIRSKSRIPNEDLLNPEAKDFIPNDSSSSSSKPTSNTDQRMKINWNEELCGLLYYRKTLRNCIITYCILADCRLDSCTVENSQLSRCVLYNSTTTNCKITNVPWLTRLPTEIRLEIYKYALEEDGKASELIDILKAPGWKPFSEKINECRRSTPHTKVPLLLALKGDTVLYWEVMEILKGREKKIYAFLQEASESFYGKMGPSPIHERRGHVEREEPCSSWCQVYNERNRLVKFFEIKLAERISYLH